MNAAPTVTSFVVAVGALTVVISCAVPLTLVLGTDSIVCTSLELLTGSESCEPSRRTALAWFSALLRTVLLGAK